MTPEQKEEIKANADECWIKADNSRGLESHLRGEVFALCEGTNELLAALEESQQQIEDFKSQRDHYRSECRNLNLLVKEQQEDIQSLRLSGNKVEYELAEEQQTIARQREALKGVFDQGYEALNVSYPISKHEIAIRSMTKIAMLAIQVEEGKVQS